MQGALADRVNHPGKGRDRVTKGVGRDAWKRGLLGQVSGPILSAGKFGASE